MFMSSHLAGLKKICSATTTHHKDRVTARTQILLEKFDQWLLSCINSAQH
jgi:hypothetical protein